MNVSRRAPQALSKITYMKYFAPNEGRGYIICMYVVRIAHYLQARQGPPKSEFGAKISWHMMLQACRATYGIIIFLERELMNIRI